MKLIVGLGNPGVEYKLTRHNIGFMILDYLADDWGVQFKKVKGNGLVAQRQYYGEKIILLKPQTYMNLSGVCVSMIMNYYKISREDLIVAHDDLDLSVGILRVRPSGSAGGHKGIDSIMQHIASQDIIRVKVGIGKAEFDTSDYVLGTFTDDEWKIITKVIPKAAEAIETLLQSDVDKAMNIFNKDYSEE